MILLAVNYHYVAAERDPAARAIFPVTTSELGAQLETLGRAFEFVSRDDVLRAVRAGSALPERSCLVTFDDGLRSQFELALPVLERLGVPGLFFVPGRPLAERRALYVHRIHRLRELVPDGELAELLEARSLAVSTEAATVHYAYDTPEAARVKYLLNVALPLGEREAVLAEASAHVELDEEALCDELYMPAEQVRELEVKHAAVGAHSFAHEPLALLDADTLRRDLEASSAVLERVTGRRPAAISYPHGSLEAVTPEVAQAAAEAGFAVGFTMERALNRSVEQPLLLARVDANDAPGGTRPLFHLDGPEPRVRPGMSGARVRYLQEAD